MRRAIVVTLLLICLCVLAWEFIPFQVAMWVGGFDLKVRVESGNTKPRSVSCQVFGNREPAAEAVARRLPPETERWATVIDPFDDQPIVVRVPTSGAISPFGRELRRAQFQYLAIIAEFPDGRVVGRVLEIPDGRTSREVSFTVP